MSMRSANQRGHYGDTSTVVGTERSTDADLNWMLLVFLPGAAALALLSQAAEEGKTGKRDPRKRGPR